MRIVPGLRELDDYPGLPVTQRAPMTAQIVSFMVTAAVSVGALASAGDSLKGAVRPEMLSRAFPGLKGAAAPLTDTPDGAGSAPLEGLEPLPDPLPLRSAFGQRKVPPPPPPQTGETLLAHDFQDAGWRPTEGGVTQMARPRFELKRWRPTRGPSPKFGAGATDEADTPPSAERDPLRFPDRAGAIA